MLRESYLLELELLKQRDEATSRYMQYERAARLAAAAAAAREEAGGEALPVAALICPSIQSIKITSEKLATAEVRA